MVISFDPPTPPPLSLLLSNGSAANDEEEEESERERLFLQEERSEEDDSFALLRRQVTITVKGYDQLLNLVLDEAVEFLRVMVMHVIGLLLLVEFCISMVMVESISSSPPHPDEISSFQALSSAFLLRCLLFQFCSKSTAAFLLLITSSPATSTSLRRGYYSTTCPEAESIVRQVMINALRSSDPRSVTSVMLIQFHECFVDERCSILDEEKFARDQNQKNIMDPGYARAITMEKSLSAAMDSYDNFLLFDTTFYEFAILISYGNYISRR
ncbi:Peroxidase 71 [Linum perenne]